MKLNEYQKRAMETCTTTSNNTLYMLTELCSETGELHGKFAKAIRKSKIEFDGNNDFESLMSSGEYESWLTDVVHEMGDILWGLAGLSSVLGLNLEFVAQENLDKLSDRQKRGVIVGDGDNR